MTINAAVGVNTVPAHVAVIMDGNGRWAQGRGLPRMAGHRAGAEALRRVLRAAADAGVRCLTLYSFSSENWKRPQGEVRGLMELLRRYLQSEIADLHANNIRLRFIGARNGLEADIVGLIENAETTTAGNDGLTLTLALNYGGRAEIVAAARDLAVMAAAGTLDPAQIDEDIFAARLLTAGLPAPDLMIRTGGERRLSNFLLWQSAYTELLFTPVCWPDFNAEHLAAAFRDYAARERRFGAVGSNGAEASRRAAAKGAAE